MKTIIAGGRDYTLTANNIIFLNALWVDLPITEVVDGGARGADRGGRDWAHSMAIMVRTFPADWNKYGKRAGYLRNIEMSKYAEVVVLFPGGAGTRSMFNEAQKRGLIIYDQR